MLPCNTFTKQERLRNKKHINRLFESGKAFLVYPFRVIFFEVDGNEETVHTATIEVLFSVPKRKVKKAVDRNRIKRLMRESYRTNKHELIGYCADQGKKIQLALIYIGDLKPTFRLVNTKIKHLLKRLNEELSQTKQNPPS